MMQSEPLEPAAAFAELGRIKLGQTSLDGVLAKVATLAKQALPGADDTSVTLVHDGQPQTAAYTGDLALDLDVRQYERGEGPCLDAAAGTTTMIVRDTAVEPRWPAWARYAASVGARSSLSIGLPIQEQVTGALTIYSTTPEAFDDDAVLIAQTFAGYAAVALANAHLFNATATLAQHIQAAMANRAVIEQAKGIIMAEQRCTADDAFAMLTRASRDSNRKLRDVATALVAQAGRQPAHAASHSARRSGRRWDAR